MTPGLRVGSGGLFAKVCVYMCVCVDIHVHVSSRAEAGAQG